MILVSEIPTKISYVGSNTNQSNSSYVDIFVLAAFICPRTALVEMLNKPGLTQILNLTISQTKRKLIRTDIRSFEHHEKRLVH